MLNSGNTWLEAQYAVLGSALIDSRVIPEILSATSDDDFNGPCKTVYRAICSVFLSGKPTDAITVNAALGDAYTAFLMQLMEITPTAANVSTYIEACKVQSQFAQLKTLGEQLHDAADPESAAALADRIVGVAARRSGLQAITMDAAMTSFFERHSHPREYLNWPLDPLNQHLFVDKGDFVVVGGYPSAGKSAFAIQTAYHLSQSKKVGFFSLETNPDKLHDRLVSHVAKVPMNRIKLSDFRDRDWEMAAAASSHIIARNLEYVPAAGASVADIRAYSMARQYDVIFVDYLQLVSAPGRDRFSVVTDVSIGLHTMAQSTGITVIALAQLTRPDETPEMRREGTKVVPTGVMLTKAPDMHHLRESGQIEQDADVILMLYRPRSDSTDRMMLIRKNKEGELRSMELGFDGKYQTFGKKQGVPAAPPGSLKAQADDWRNGAKKMSERPRPAEQLSVNSL